MTQPTFQAEMRLWKKGYNYIACLDEAGRGPLAGPVTAAAVIIQPVKLKIKNLEFKIILKEIKDSKQLPQKKREQLYKLITRNKNIEWGIGTVSEKVIDKINIKNAAELAMVKAVKKLKIKPDFLIIDGSHVKNSELKIKNSKLIVKADEKVFSCSAASIIAKVWRDRIILKYHKKYPRYRFDLHKGYPTVFHLKMLKKYGPCKIHRKSFGPVRAVIGACRTK